MAHDGFARTINPVHTMADGDTIFAAATGTSQVAPDLTTIGAVAAEAMARAVNRAVFTATGIRGYPCLSRSRYIVSRLLLAGETSGFETVALNFDGLFALSRPVYNRDAMRSGRQMEGRRRTAYLLAVDENRAPAWRRCDEEHSKTLAQRNEQTIVIGNGEDPARNVVSFQLGRQGMPACSQ